MEAACNFIIKNLLRIPRFFSQFRLYGFNVAFWTLLFPFNRLFFNNRLKIAAHKHVAILKYLSNCYNNILIKYKNIINVSNSFLESDATIWVCWWDGENNMPPIVKSCYNSIVINAASHPVVLITKYNYFNYISIPEKILNKVNSGIITITHFSNILRANLIYEYGGIWLDSTILVLNKIVLNDLSFFTLKAPAKKSVSVTINYFLDSSYRKEPHFKNETEISYWSGFLLAGVKQSFIFAYLREILHAYWNEHNNQIDYLLFDYLIALGYQNIPAMKHAIDNVPCIEYEKFELEKALNKEYNEKIFKEFKLSTFHKLTWKKRFSITTNNNKNTLYAYLLSNY